MAALTFRGTDAYQKCLFSYRFLSVNLNEYSLAFYTEQIGVCKYYVLCSFEIQALPFTLVVGNIINKCS